MKVLVLGDDHGRVIWRKIIEEENPDLVIFLGDYVSTHEGISAEQQLSNLEEILKYKEENPDKVILLRGNHDTQHLDYYWAECSGHDRKVSSTMYGMRERFLKTTQWIYVMDNVIFSHAGVSQVWLDEIAEPHLRMMEKLDEEEPVVLQINKLDPCEAFGFIPDSWYDNYGESVTQPPLWIRPSSLLRSAVKGYTQVVGHTPTEGRVDTALTEDGDRIWFCDCLGEGGYLIINDGEFWTGSIR